MIEEPDFTWRPRHAGDLAVLLDALLRDALELNETGVTATYCGHGKIALETQAGLFFLKVTKDRR